MQALPSTATTASGYPTDRCCCCPVSPAREPAHLPATHPAPSAASARLSNLHRALRGGRALWGHGGSNNGVPLPVCSCGLVSWHVVASCPLRFASALRASGRLLSSPLTPAFLLSLLAVCRTTASGGCRAPTTSPHLAKRTTWSPPPRTLRKRWRSQSTGSHHAPHPPAHTLAHVQHTIAGRPRRAGLRDGRGRDAQFNEPGGIACGKVSSVFFLCMSHAVAVCTMMLQMHIACE